MKQMKDKEVEIVVAYHRPFPIFENEVLTPIHVGKVFSSFEFDIQADNTGDNISHLNHFYAELTALYWLWKNSNAKIKGLFHYRRLLDLNKGNKNSSLSKYNLKVDDLKDDIFKKLDLTESNIKNILKESFVITRKKEDIHSWIKKSVYEQYSYEHHIDHFNIAMDILKLNYPSIYNVAKKEMHGHWAYFTNILVMKDKDFNEYCSWLFGILEEVQKKINLYDYRIAPYTKNARWAGFLAERLTSFYLMYHKTNGKNISEFPAVYLENTLSDNNDINKHKDSINLKNKNTQEYNNKIIPKVSVIMGVYNGETYLSSALESILSQTLKNIEIIIVNDGSNDSSPKICSKYKLQDNRITIINFDKNKGLGHARNVGLEKAKGEYIHFMDADDLLEEDFLITLVDSADKHLSDITVTSYKRFTQDPNQALLNTIPWTIGNGETNIEDNIDLFLLPPNMWNKLFRREFIKNFKFFNKGSCEDIDFWWRALINTRKVSFVIAFKYLYRDNHENSIQRNIDWSIKGLNNFLHAERYILNQPPEIIQMFMLLKAVYYKYTIGRVSESFNFNYYKFIIFKNKCSKFLNTHPIKAEKEYMQKILYYYADSIEKCITNGNQGLITIRKKILNNYFIYFKYQLYKLVKHLTFGKLRKKIKHKVLKYKKKLKI